MEIQLTARPSFGYKDRCHFSSNNFPLGIKNITLALLSNKNYKKGVIFFTKGVLSNLNIITNYMAMAYKISMSSNGNLLKRKEL